MLETCCALSCCSFRGLPFSFLSILLESTSWAHERQRKENERKEKKKKTERSHSSSIEVPFCITLRYKERNPFSV
jgi:hypothetical protein